MQTYSFSLDSNYCFSIEENYHYASRLRADLHLAFLLLSFQLQRKPMRTNFAKRRYYGNDE